MAPLIAGRPATSVATGATYSFTPASGDSDGDPLSFGVDAKPLWASFDTATGRLTGTPSPADAGVYRSVVVWVTDGTAVTSLPAFDLAVTNPVAINRPPQISGTPQMFVLAGSTYAFTPDATDEDGDALAFTIQNRPPWASFDPSNGRLSGTPQAAGTFPGIVISVTDGPATVSLAAFDLVVTAPASNRAPLISGTPPPRVEAGDPYTFVPTANDPDNDALTFAIQQAPAWAAFDTGTGRLSGTPPAGTVQTYGGIVITVSDGALSAALPAFSIDVTAPTPNRIPVITGSPPIAAVEGTAYTFQPVATDPDGDPLSFDIANPPSWAQFDKATGLLAGTPRTGDKGTYDNIVISVSDGKAAAAMPAFAIAVTSPNRPPVISGIPPNVVTVGQRYVFQPSASDPDNDALTYSIVNRPSWAAFDSKTGSLSGTPGVSDGGQTLPIVISVSDGPSTDALPFSIFVNRPPAISGTPALTASTGGTYSFSPAFSDADAGTTLTFGIQNQPRWAAFDGTTGELWGTPGPADAGVTFPGIVIYVSDGYSTQLLPPFSITVTVPPLATGSALLSWTPPTQNTDGTVLTNLAGYRIYWGTSLGTYTNAVSVDNPGIASYQVDGLAPGTYFFVVTARNSENAESEFSNAASKTVQ